jgi:peptidoglycan/LPS O-acetylase OafA/YrhL
VDASVGQEVGSEVRLSEPGRLAYVDGLRALAALYVVVTHAVLIAAPVHHGTRTEGARPSWLPPGHFAVAVFIVVSGFCLTLPIVRADGRLVGGVRHFYRRRARRILPAYYAAFALTLVLVWTVVGEETGTFWDYSVPISVAGYIGNALLLQDLVGYWQVSVPFWSIAVEVQIYLLFPLLLLWWRKFGARRTVFYAVVLSYVAMIASYFAGTVGPAFFPGLTLYFVGLFALGMAGAWMATSNGPSWVRARGRVPWSVLAVGFAVCAAVLGYIAGESVDALTPFIELPLALFVVCLLVAASRPGQSARLRACLGFRPLAFIGMFSYSLYLIHAPLLQAQWQYALRPRHLGSGLTFTLLAVIGVPLVLLAAYLFHRTCERPFMNRRARPEETEASGEVLPLPAPRINDALPAAVAEVRSMPAP